MDTFLENAQRIFDVARADSGAESSDFALLVQPDGSLHFVMESTMSLDAVARENGAPTAYLVSRSNGEVRVSGRNRVGNHGTTQCELTGPGASRRPAAFLRDQPLYLLSPSIPAILRA